MSGYGCFADYYDLFSFNTEYDKIADFICALFEKHGVKNGASVADLACGTGSLLVELARRGYDMTGVDASPEMLCAARQKADESGFSPLLVCQSLDCLDLYGSCDAAVSTLDSLNHMTDFSDIRALFERLPCFINVGGLLIFDVNTPFKHREVLGDNCFVLETPEVFCAWQNTLDEESLRVDIDLDFFVNENGLYRRESESFSERAYEIDSLSELLIQNGFEILGIFDGYTDLPLREDSQRAVFAAVRK